MLKLKLRYEKEEDVPEAFKELYEEKDGGWALTGVEGIKTDADVARLTTALNKERRDHKDTKDKLAKFKDLDPDQVHDALAEAEELKARAGEGDGKNSNEQVEAIVAARVKRATAPLERERDRLREQVEELKASQGELSGQIRKSTIEAKVRAHATEAKVVGTAVEDVLLYANSIFEVTESGDVVTRDGVGVTPGLSPDVWLKDMQGKRPHWWAASEGGGAGGSGRKMPGGEDNPWSAAHWNMTKQGAFIRQHGQEKAGQMAKIAGTYVGGPRPVEKSGD